MYMKTAFRIIRKANRARLLPFALCKAARVPYTPPNIDKCGVLL